MDADRDGGREGGARERRKKRQPEDQTRGRGSEKERKGGCRVWVASACVVINIRDILNNLIFEMKCPR